MNQNLEKYTKAELISKLQNIKKESQVDKVNKTAVPIKQKESSPTFIDIIFKFKIWVLSLTIIAILLKIFKQYKSVRAVLKLANYIVWSMFGLSIFEAFGFSFLIKFFTELRYIFGSIINYLTDSTFYNYMKSVLKVAEENQSVRGIYKEPKEKIDWKAEFDKAERQREIDKWKEKYSKHQEDGIDKKTIALLLLLLGGTITTWYYGPELLNIFSPVWNLSELIKSILRGRNPGDDTDDENVSVTLENKSNLTPEALNKNHLNTVAPTPPAPPATIEGPPAPSNPFLAEIEKGKKLKKAVTIVKSTLKTGKVIEKDITENSEGGMMEHLKNSLDKLRPMVTGEDSELDIPKSGDNWEDSGETTPTNILDKGKEVDRHSPSRSISPDMLVYSSDKEAEKIKFLESIKSDRDYKSTSSEIAPILKPLLERFPNLSQETLEKLSTVEGLKNRHKIIASLPENELKSNDTPIKDLAIKKISDMSNEEQIKMDKIVKSTLNLDSENLTAKLQEEFPDYKFDVGNYKESFMLAIEEEINTGNTEEEREAIRQEIQKFDLSEIQSTVGTSDIKKIRNVIRENYTHNSLLNEIKNSNDSILQKKIDDRIAYLIDDNPALNKQEIIEKLLSENPENKDRILKLVSKSMHNQISLIKSKLSAENIEKFDKLMVKEDLKEIQNLSENKSIDQIKSLASVNSFHADHLHEIKRKSSQMSVNNPTYTGQIETIFQEPSSSNNQSSNKADTTHLDDTMNLFD